VTTVADQLGSLTFASFIRQGLAASVTRPDGVPTGKLQTRASIKLNVKFNNDATGQTTAQPILDLVGPGDIVGLDSRVVVRAWPPPNDNDAEFGSLALVEFDQADLPWRYSPAAATSDNKLRPWLTLIVLDEGNGEATLQSPTPANKVTTVQVKDVSVLPDLTNAWAWAHTQFAGAGVLPAQMQQMIQGAPGQFVSRILSPRSLASKTSYLACLVPTFFRGVQIGTGQQPDTTTDVLTLAWNSSGNNAPGFPPPAAGPITLPVYYFWRFQTGTVGSFKQLALLIQPQPLPADVGRRTIDVSSPGLSLPPTVSTTPATMQVEGALQSVQAAAAGPSPWSTADQNTWIAALKQFVNPPTITVNATALKLVVPPLYGQWYATQSQLTSATPAGSNPPWFFTLNSDPRPRIGGGLGAVVVQNNQDALLASAWSQAGDIRTINGFLRVLQLGREVWSRAYNRHVATGTPDTFWTLTGGVNAFVHCNGQTMCQQFASSPVGPWLFDPIWRRIARPFGPVGRNQGAPLQPNGSTSNIVSKSNSGQQAAPDPPPPSGLFTPSPTFSEICFDIITNTQVITLTQLGADLLLFWGLVIIYTARQLLVSQNGACYWQTLRMLKFGIDLIVIGNSLVGTSIGDVQRRVNFCLGRLTSADINSGPPAPNFVPVLNVPSSIQLPPQPGAAGTTDDSDASALRAALGVLFDTLAQGAPAAPQPTSIPNLAACQKSITAELDPAVTIVKRVQNRLRLDPSVVWNPKDALEPIFAPPTYQTPMYGPLAAVSSEWILPGLTEVGRDTVAIALTNQRFVEAYMVGVNDEMTRALRWNEFPVDQRSTYFRQFWDVSGIVPPQGSTIDPETLRDILPIATWSPTGTLGTNSARETSVNGSERLVLVVRAQLIQRYPSVIVYAVPAQVGAGPNGGLGLSTTEIHPVFNAFIAPDVAFYGFEIPLEQAAAKTPGYFFVLQEQPGEPKFLPGPEASPTSPGSFVIPPAADTSAGRVATDLFDKPFRIAIHGSRLLPPQS
jgi:hypothetical protein